MSTAEPDPPASGGSETSNRRLITALTALVVVVALALLVSALISALGSEELVVEVPEGTAERMAAGEQIELLPRTLEVEVGDRLVVVNRDEVTHEVGPYTVAAGQTLAQTFTSPGTIEGLCTLHPSGAITIVVR